MADIVKIALFGGAAYLAYEYFFASPSGTPATSAPSGTIPNPVSTGATPPAATPPAVKYPPLTQIFQGMVQKSIDAYQQPNCGPQPTIGMISVAGGAMIPNPADVTALANWQTCQGNATPLFTMDDWNAFVVAADGPNPMPNPVPVFPGIDRSTKMTALQYWAGMAPVLGAQGLSGWRGGWF